MNPTPIERVRTTLRRGALLALLPLAACTGMRGMPDMATMSGPMAASMGASVSLGGDQEVPAVNTRATGMSTIRVATDGSVSGSVSTTGVAATMAHIHSGAAGANGPVLVTLQRMGDAMWMVPAGARLTAEQLTAYRAGGLYVNVHSEAFKGGEIRAQLKP